MMEVTGYDSRDQLRSMNPEGQILVKVSRLLRLLDIENASARFKEAGDRLSAYLDDSEQEMDNALQVEWLDKLHAAQDELAALLA